MLLWLIVIINYLESVFIMDELILWSLLFVLYLFFWLNLLLVWRIVKIIFIVDLFVLCILIGILWFLLLILILLFMWSVIIIFLLKFVRVLLIELFIILYIKWCSLCIFVELIYIVGCFWIVFSFLSIWIELLLYLFWFIF